MNKRLHICFAFILLSLAAIAQKEDHIWIGGLNEFPGSPMFGNFIIDLKNDSISAEMTNLNMNFESTVAALADSAGSTLLYYSNGCEVRNGQGELLINGDGLNPGEISDLVCNKNGYIAPKGAMLLPMPGNENHCILLHTTVSFDINNKLQNSKLSYSLIQKNTDEVIEKNVLLTEGNFEPFTVVRHGNGRDWWIVMPELGTNVYHTFLLDKDGVEKMPNQTIGEEILEVDPFNNYRNPNYTASSTFSPNGKKYARFLKYNLALMDFDRCSGSFSNFHLIEGDRTSIGGGGVCFSQSSNKLYATTQLAVHEINVNSPSIGLDTAIAGYDIFGKSLHMMQRFPDGRIAISSTNRETTFAIINSPENDENNIGVEMFDFDLPVYYVRGLPYFPNYRLFDYEGSLCDTLGIDTQVSAQEVKKGDFIVFPNPATNQITLNVPFSIPGGSTFILYDNIGSELLVRKIKVNAKTPESIILPYFNDGVYFWRIFTEDEDIKAAGKLLIKH